MKRKIWLRLVLSVMAVMALLLWSVPALGATTAVVTVTYTPSYIAISISPTTWTINDVASAGGKTVLTSTTYYSNPLGDTTSPTVGGAVDGECLFTLTNTSSIITDIKVTSSNASGGSDAMTNGNTGSAGATSYGAKSYFTGQATGAWVISKSSGTDIAKASLAATTNIKCGMIIATQTGAWAGGTASTFTVTFGAAAH